MVHVQEETHGTENLFPNSLHNLVFYSCIVNAENLRFTQCLIIRALCPFQNIRHVLLELSLKPKSHICGPLNVEMKPLVNEDSAHMTL